MKTNTEYHHHTLMTETVTEWPGKHTHYTELDIYRASEKKTPPLKITQDQQRSRQWDSKATL